MTATEKRGQFGTSIIFEGTEDEWKSWKESYFRNWHPCGYGTRVTHEDVADGVVSAVVRRYNHCD